MNAPYRLLGGPGSPYSMKLRAILRYRRLPHLWIVPRGFLNTGGELARANKKLLPVLQYPDGTYHADTTPIAYELERLHPGERSIYPPDPAAAFLAHLIEDMADEMLSTAMFDLRWAADPDRTFCATRQLSGWLSPMPRAEFESMVARFIERQVVNRARVVRGDGCSTILSRLYLEVLDALESMLQTRAFLFGSRPSIADFGLFGQLSQYAIDPSASEVMRERAPRVFQWTQTVDDASGIDGEWADPAEHGEAVHRLLAAIGRWYLPILQANALAASEGRDRFELEVDGVRWVGAPDRYKTKCLGWLRSELARMPEAARASVEPVLARHGCRDALAPGAAPTLSVPPMAPV